MSEYLDGDPDEDYEDNEQVIERIIVRLGRVTPTRYLVAYLPGDKEEMSETQQKIENITNA
jgi:hypothetical protein